MSICFLYLRTYKNIYVHAEIKGKKINIIVFSFQIIHIAIFSRITVLFEIMKDY